MVEKYSLASKYPLGLNMISGSAAGAHKVGQSTSGEG